MRFSYPHPPSGYSPYLKGRVCGVELFGGISLFRNSSPKVGEVAAEPPEGYYWPFRHTPMKIAFRHILIKEIEAKSDGQTNS